jgi:threonine dehydrogenase-like Zn-dependent dehydrogenase
VKALLFDGARAHLAEVSDPAPAEGYALLRTTLAGICNTDLEIVRGYMGFQGVLGHELVGVVEQGPAAWVGKRVVSEINFACGRCLMCERSLGRHCSDRTVMGILGSDGAFADKVAVPIANLHAVPDEVSDTRAVFAEPLAAAFEIAEQIDLGEHREAVVFGDGKLGLLVAQVLAYFGLSVLAVGKHADHLAILEARGIATTLLDDWDRTPRDLVVEATGSDAGFSLAVGATRPRGTLVLKSTVAGKTTLDLAPLVINEITVVGSRCGPFAPALVALASDSIEVDAMVAARRPLSDGVAALELAGERGCLKVLLEP